MKKSDIKNLLEIWKIKTGSKQKIKSVYSLVQPYTLKGEKNRIDLLYGLKTSKLSTVGQI
jgi:hypothetical protein